jgi:hypothetical protein
LPNLPILMCKRQPQPFVWFLRDVTSCYLCLPTIAILPTRSQDLVAISPKFLTLKEKHYQHSPLDNMEHFLFSNYCSFELIATKGQSSLHNGNELLLNFMNRNESFKPNSLDLPPNNVSQPGKDAIIWISHPFLVGGKWKSCPKLRGSTFQVQSKTNVGWLLEMTPNNQQFCSWFF